MVYGSEDRVLQSIPVDPHANIVKLLGRGTEAKSEWQIEMRFSSGAPNQARAKQAGDRGPENTHCITGLPLGLFTFKT